MKRIFVIWIILAGVCITHLLICHQEIGFLWREWTSYARHFTYEKHYAEFKIPIFSSSVAKQDPEAADVGESVMRHWDSEQYNEQMEYLSNFALRYPENQFFIYQLVDLLNHSLDWSNPKLSGLFVQRLLAMDSQNGLYHFLNAAVILRDEGYEGMDSALAELETGLDCPRIVIPYDYYYSRVESLFEKEKIAESFKPAIRGTKVIPAYLLHGLYDFVANYSRYLIVNGRIKESQALNDRLEKISEKTVARMNTEHPYTLSFLRPDFEIHSIEHQPTQITELQMLSVSPPRVGQIRMELIVWNDWSKNLQDNTRDVCQNAPKEPKESTILLFPPAVHSGQMLLASIAGLICFAGLAAARKLSYSPPGFLAWLVLFMAAVAMFLMTHLWAYSRLFEICSCMYSFSEAVAPPYACVDRGDDFIAYRYMEGLCLGGLLVLGLLRKTRFGQWIGRRIIWCLLLAGFLGVASLELSRWGMAFLIPMFLFVVLSTLILASREKPAEKTGHGIALLWAKEPDALAYRGRCLHIIAGWTLLYLTIFTFCGPLMARFGLQESQYYAARYDGYAGQIQLPQFQINERLYPEMLARFDDPNLTWDEAKQWLPCVMPEDLPEILKKVNMLDVRSSVRRQYGMLPPPQISLDPNRPPDGYALYENMEQIKQFEWASAMEQCGRDAMPYFLPYFKNPDNCWVLYARCKLGDRQAAEKMKSLWRAYKDRHPDEKKPFDPNSPAAGYSFGRATEGIIMADRADEAIRCYKDYFSHYEQNDLEAPDHQWLSSLSDPYRAKMVDWIAQYAINKNKEGLLSDLFFSESYYLSQPMLCRVIEAFIKSEYFSMENWNHRPFIDEIAAASLIRGLDSENAAKCSVCLYLLDRAEVKLTPEHIQKLQKDNSPLVRAYMTMLPSNNISADDPSPFVRLVRGLAEKNETAKQR